jgi:YHS domain-containing protein
VIRIALFLALAFLLLALLRIARMLLATCTRTSARPRIEAEMVRDPVCGTWVDRRVAVAARRAGDTVAVCSEKCRRELDRA